MLRLELAAMLDMRPLVQSTYELEGDRLELLLIYDRIEKLRALGRALERGDEGILPNVGAALRSSVKPQKGVDIMKPFAGHGTFKGVISAGPYDVQSSLHPGEERPGYCVYYAADKTYEDLEEEELRPLICIKGKPERKAILDGLSPAFAYLERRITGECDAQFSCVHMYQIFSCVHMYQISRAAQAFNPAFAAQHLTPARIDDLAVIKPLLSHASLADLKKASSPHILHQPALPRL